MLVAIPLLKEEAIELAKSLKLLAASESASFVSSMRSRRRHGFRAWPEHRHSKGSCAVSRLGGGCLTLCAE